MIANIGGMEGLAPIILDAGLKSIFVLCAAAIAVGCMKRSSAAARHLVWFLSIGSLIALPFLSWALPGWHVLPKWLDARQPVLASQTSSSQEAPAMPLPQIPESPRPILTAPESQPINPPRETIRETREVASVPATQSPGEATKISRVLNPWGWGTAAWLTGAGVALVPVLLGMLSLWRLGRNARPETAIGWLELVRRVADSLRMRRAVALLKTAHRRMPMTWGVVRPKLLLPDESQEWPEERRRVVLLHELAHAKRWDYLTNLVTRLVCALYWFNPLVWIAARRMVVERERACDDIVLNHGAKPADYAEQILQIAANLPLVRFSAYGGIPIARPSKLEGRLRAILDGRQNRAALTRFVVLAMVALLTIFVVPMAMMKAATSSATPGGSTNISMAPTNTIQSGPAAESGVPDGTDLLSLLATSDIAVSGQIEKNDITTASEAGFVFEYYCEFKVRNVFKGNVLPGTTMIVSLTRFSRPDRQPEFKKGDNLVLFLEQGNGFRGMLSGRTTNIKFGVLRESPALLAWLRAIPFKDTSSSYGPVTYRRMQIPPGLTATYLDLDNGEMVTNHPPGDLTMLLGESDMRVRHALDMITVGVSSNRWDATAAEVLAELAKATPQKQARLGGLESRRTFFFKTQEGAAGILQVLPEEQGSVRIRYKLISKAVGESASQPPRTTEAKTDVAQSASVTPASNWGEAVQGLQVSLAAKKQVWTTNETPVLSADIWNTGNIVWQTSANDYRWRVEVDGDWYRGKANGGRLTNINSGANMSNLSIDLSALEAAAPSEMDINTYGSGGGGSIPRDFKRDAPKLGPGKHTVRFGIIARRAFAGAEPRVILATSNPVEIEIEDVQSASAAPQSNPGEIKGGIQARLEMDKLVWGKAEDPRFKISVRNSGSRELTTSGIASMALEVDGKLYPPRVWMMRGANRSYQFGPGKDYTWTNSVGDFATAERRSDRLQLAPGKYTVRIVFLNNSRNGLHISLNSPYPDPVLAYSNPVEIEIRDGENKEAGISNQSKGVEKSDWGEADKGIQVRLHTPDVTIQGGTTPQLLVDIANQGPWRFQSMTNDYVRQLEVDGRWYVADGLRTQATNGVVAESGGVLLEMVTGRPWTNLPLVLNNRWRIAHSNELGTVKFGGGGWIIPNGEPEYLKLSPGKHIIRLAVIASPRFAIDRVGPARAVSQPVEIEIQRDADRESAANQTNSVSVKVVDATTRLSINNFVLTPALGGRPAALDLLAWDSAKAQKSQTGTLKVGISSDRGLYKKSKHPATCRNWRYGMPPIIVRSGPLSCARAATSPGRCWDRTAAPLQERKLLLTSGLVV